MMSYLSHLALVDIELGFLYFDHYYYSDLEMGQERSIVELAVG
jgi:hypothetical protein